MSASVTFRGPDRKRAIILLAGSCTDPGHFLFDPKGALRGKSTSGLGGAKKVACRVCVVGVKEPQPGLEVDRFGRTKPCPACTKPGKAKGTGKVDADSVRGTDGHEHTVVVQTESTNAAATKEPRKRTCLECDGDGALPNGRRCRNCRGEGRITVDAFVISDTSRVELDPVDRYWKAMRKRNASGDYEQFEKVFGDLARSRSVPFHRVYMMVPPLPLECLTEVERGYVRRAFQFFEEWMPAEIRVPRWVVEADTAAKAQVSPRGRDTTVAVRKERNAVWRERHQSGETTAAIASSEGVDRRTVERGIERAA